MPDAKRPTVLLLEDNPVLRALEEHIVVDAGFHVDLLPARASPLVYALQRRPDVMVAHIGATDPYQLALVDELEATPATRTIPFVAISMVDATAAAAQAGPTVNRAIVAPDDIDRRLVCPSRPHPNSRSPATCRTRRPIGRTRRG